MGNNRNCDTCGGNARNQMDMRSPRTCMMGRYPQGQMPRMQGNYNECDTAREVKQCDDCGDIRRDMLRGIPLAMGYVPWQTFECTYEPAQGLRAGTIFPELDKPFYGRRGMR